MLYKIFFLGVILFSSMGIGNVIVGEKRTRIRLLTALQKGGRALEDALVLEGLPLIEGLRAAEKASETGLFAHMAEAAAAHPAFSGREIAETVAAGLPETLYLLQPPELEIVGDLIARAASAVSPEQIGDAAAMYGRQMYTMITELSEEHAKKEKTIRALCLCIGLALAVILA